MVVCTLLLLGACSTLHAVDGTSGNNTWTGTSGDDLYNGLGGNDVIKGLEGNDTLNGDAGDDTIIGDAGEDTLNGGSGNDTITAGMGGASYTRTATQFQAYGGSGGGVRSWLRPGHLYPSGIIEALASSGGSSYISTSKDDDPIGPGYTDTMHLKGFDFSAIADGTVITGMEITIIKDQWTLDHSVRVRKADGSLGAEQGTSTSATTVTYGGSASMMGLSLTGADVKNPNFGFQFRMKINSPDLRNIRVDHARITIYTAGTNADTHTNHITGGSGNDDLFGSDQSDHYYYNSGDGLDAITEINAGTSNADRLILGPSISPNDVGFRRSENPLDLYLTYQQDPIVVLKGWYTDAVGDYGLDHIEFDDGTVWNRADYHDLTWNLPQWGDQGDNVWSGNELGNTYNGRAGNDTINGNGGDDYLDGDDGDDTISGNEGKDTLIGDLGGDTLNGGNGDDILAGRFTPAAQGSVPGLVVDLEAGQPGTKWDPIGALTAPVQVQNADLINYSNGGTGNSSVNPLRMTGFDFSAIADSANITGISILISSSGSSRSVPELRLRDASGTTGVNLSDGTLKSSWSDDIFDDGKVGGLILTPAMVKDPGFGFEVTFSINGELANVSIHYVQVIITTDADPLSSTGMNYDYDTASNTFNGQGGNDTIYGASGNDTYLYNSGDGLDTIYDGNLSDGDKLILGPGILPANLTFARMPDHDDVALQHMGSNFLIIKNFQDDAQPYAGIDLIEFDDGTIWNRSYMEGVIADLPFVGTAGSDTWFGRTFDHEYHGLAGDDYISAGADLSRDILRGNEGDDTIVGGRNQDHLYGGADNDTLMGDWGHDILEGGHGDDVIAGRYAPGAHGGPPGLVIDLEAGQPGDKWQPIGSLTTPLQEIDGQKSDFDNGGTGNSGINPLRMTGFDFSGIDDSANITGVAIMMATSGSGSRRIVELKLRTAAGTYSSNLANSNNLGGYTYIYVNAVGNTFGGLALTPSIVKDPNFGLDIEFTYNEELAAIELDYFEVVLLTDVRTGNGYDHELSGNTFRGQEGDDTLYGSSRADTYYYNVGDGNDTLYESQRDLTNNDRLVFGAGIVPTHVTFIRAGNDLIANVDTIPSGSVTLKNWSVAAGHQSIERIVFDDSTVWEISDINAAANVQVLAAEAGTRKLGTQLVDSYVGSSGDDVIGGNYRDIHAKGALATYGNIYDAGQGNDTVYGSGYGDIFRFNQGDGNDTIIDGYSAATTSVYTDRLVLGAGLLVANVTVTREADDLKLSFSTGESIQIRNWFISSGFQVERIEFNDRTVWAPADINAQLAQGSPTDLLWHDTTTNAATTGRRSSGSPVTGAVYSSP